MDEVIKKPKMIQVCVGHIKRLFWSEPVLFSSKGKINFRGISTFVCCFLGLFCVVIFWLPVPEKETQHFNDHHAAGGESLRMSGQDNNGQSNGDPLSPKPGHTVSVMRTASGGAPENTTRNTSMIISRGNDSSTTLPPGTTFWVKLTQSVTATSQAIPVIGIVLSSVTNQSSVAISENSQIFGEVTVNTDSGRASILWKSILFPDGRSKPLSAIALGDDNQAGVEGDYHSDAAKNTAGEMISRFVAGVAEGSVTRTAFGGDPGGLQQGLLQGVADTAKDRSDHLTESLKKQKEWIELHAGQKFQSILSEPFIFRDPGGTY